MSDPNALTLGGRLRAIRQQQAMSLQAVEQRSGGVWKAVVVGSYERGDRAITVSKLIQLADFYGVPVAQLLPDGPIGQPRPIGGARIVVNLEAMAALPVEVVGPLARFVASIQAKRGDYNGRILTLRAADLETLALLYDRTPAETRDHLVSWGAIQAAD